jgi:DNA-directed RNA polymerase specialized sigma24 family protein
MDLSEKARQLRNAYQHEWRKKHPEKARQYNETYWERKASSYTPADKARDLQAQGYTQRQIAEALGISLGAVNAILNAE